MKLLCIKEISFGLWEGLFNCKIMIVLVCLVFFLCVLFLRIKILCVLFVVFCL